MTTKRTALERSIEGIRNACGLDAFFDQVIDCACKGDSLEMMRGKLPYKLSANRLQAVLAEFYPDMLPLWDLPVRERRPAMQRLIGQRAAHCTLSRRRKAVILSLYDANHSLYKYFTDEWWEKYGNQHTQATSVRGIEWHFDFVSWIMWWVVTGHIDERGPGNGYQMCRYGDTGPYSPSNCYCATGDKNRADARIFASAV